MLAMYSLCAFITGLYCTSAILSHVYKANNPMVAFCLGNSTDAYGSS